MEVQSTQCRKCRQTIHAEKRNIGMAYFDWMRGYSILPTDPRADSVTCRSCFDAFARYQTTEANRLRTIADVTGDYSGYEHFCVTSALEWGMLEVVFAHALIIQEREERRGILTLPTSLQPKRDSTVLVWIAGTWLPRRVCQVSQASFTARTIARVLRFKDYGHTWMWASEAA